MSSFQDFQKAIVKLDEVLKENKTEITRDSAIKRFEICFDLAWKAIKIHAQKEGLECYSPRTCFKTAFQLKLIAYDELWLKMVDDRNSTAHLYGEDLADVVYKNLSSYLELFKKLALNLSASS